MSSINNLSSARVRPLVTSWMSGPASAGDGPVVVSVTEYAAHSLRHLPGVAYSGMRMREGWYAMPGAVGLWLWSLPASGLSGSISVWTSQEALQQFIILPHHVDIMRRYRDRGDVRSTTWEDDTFDRVGTIARAREWIERES
ncbi:hypothetical protein [Mycolicibacterium setense]|uniref:hypothetical protein n=1 Tax=Mycolicibacterium setense TaxID=431269 RepID=UPI00068C15CF|nr:hypothetical protein [Mycolicibacterium setense]MCV7115270.1 hypothetical protein [Mycolicibacterium setense]